MKIESISYEFANRKAFQERPPTIDVTIGSSTEGFIEVSISDINLVTLDATIYKLLAPTSTESRYIKTGLDLYTSERLYVSYDKLDNGNIRIYWVLDTGALDVSVGDKLGVTFFINKNQNVLKIKNSIDIVINIKGI